MGLQSLRQQMYCCRQANFPCAHIELHPDIAVWINLHHERVKTRRKHVKAMSCRAVTNMQMTQAKNVF